MRRDDDFIVFTPSDERDPDGSKLQGVFTTHFACERARGARELLVHILAVMSFLIWPQAVWPTQMPPTFRAFVLAAWAVLFIVLALSAASEWWWKRQRARYLSDLRPPSPTPLPK